MNENVLFSKVFRVLLKDWKKLLACTIVCTLFGAVAGFILSSFPQKKAPFGADPLPIVSLFEAQSFDLQVNELAAAIKLSKFYLNELKKVVSLPSATGMELESEILEFELIILPSLLREMDEIDLVRTEADRTQCVFELEMKRDDLISKIELAKQSRIIFLELPSSIPNGNDVSQVFASMLTYALEQPQNEVDLEKCEDKLEMVRSAPLANLQLQYDAFSEKIKNYFAQLNSINERIFQEALKVSEMSNCYIQAGVGIDKSSPADFKIVSVPLHAPDSFLDKMFAATVCGALIGFIFGSYFLLCGGFKKDKKSAP